ncbi:MAG TPA: aminomethyl-transferring glycine dehydrogenase subunit GcvPB [Pirellulales bacterium]|jgi:glycine dehydrogenase subunit 2|nr:aminomethyl-transferring glycine dehydrogenase subunit GcvPB [Pirellulales bacterium]
MRNTLATQLLFELSKPGRRDVRLPKSDVPEVAIDELLPAGAIAAAPPPLPELAETQIVRHFLNLSTQNMSVDTHFYPLGSCTMKYNPKRNERLANLPGMADLHPYQPEETLQGMLELLYAMQQILAEIAGLDAVSLQPAAGAHGEFTALMVAAAYFRDRGERRTKVLTPDSSHGTNPASAAMAGFETVTVKSDSSGCVDLADLRTKLDGQTAVFMITNPNTLGLFDRQVRTIADEVHSHGGLIYLDGANMNAILGIARPGDFGADLMHFNPHKTFSGPHGGGGPGAGPIAVRAMLEPYLPSPVVVKVAENINEQANTKPSKNGDGAECHDCYRLAYDRPKSIGRVRSFMGNVGVLVRAYCYIRTYGPAGLRAVSENAVLSANYLLARVKHILPVPHGDRCLHEFVATAARLKAERGVSAMDLAKRLLDYGFHAPTVYFPLTVRESMMIEPTETESKETLDAFAETLSRIVEESPELLHDAPHTTAISRPDEVAAARNPVLHWSPAGAKP